jgi:hypothetical protein
MVILTLPSAITSIFHEATNTPLFGAVTEKFVGATFLSVMGIVLLQRLLLAETLNE